MDMAKLNLDLAVDAAITTNLKHKDDFNSREDYIDWSIRNTDISH